MIVKRGVLANVNINYISDNLKSYSLKIKGCDDIIPMNFISNGCSNLTLFSLLVGCEFQTGTFDYELLEDAVSVKDGVIFIND